MRTHRLIGVTLGGYMAVFFACDVYPNRAAAEEPSGIAVSGKVKSGEEGLAGVRLNGLPGNPLTDDDGAYAVEVPSGWNGSIVPALWGYGFTPAVVSYTDLTETQNQDFLAHAQVCTVNGSVTQDGNGLAGVMLNGLPGNPVTDSNGTFTTRASAGWSAMVTPALEGYAFTPSTYTFQDLRDDYSMAFTARTQAAPEEPSEPPSESSPEPSYEPEPSES